MFGFLLFLVQLVVVLLDVLRIVASHNPEISQLNLQFAQWQVTNV
jgi:hypothetical protein